MKQARQLISQAGGEKDRQIEKRGKINKKINKDEHQQARNLQGRQVTKELGKHEQAGSSANGNQLDKNPTSL